MMLSHEVSVAEGNDAIKSREEIHKVFNQFFSPAFMRAYIELKQRYKNDMLLVMADHPVDDDFYWELNSFLIDINRRYLPEEIRNQPITSLPYNSTNNEFLNILKKMGNGTMLLDYHTFNTLTFKNKDPFYFYSNRIVIHRSGEISFYAGRKF